MKRILTSLLCLLAIYSTINAQTYCIDYQVVSTGATFVIDVKLRGSAAFDLGTSTIVFTYNGASLTNPILVTDYMSASNKYNATTVVKTNPSAEGTASINIFLKTVNDGSTIAADPSSTNIARISFTNSGVGTSNLAFGNLSDVFKSNNMTQLSRTTGCGGLDVTLPIELIAFDAKRAKNTTLLEWTSVNALDMATFDVQRSNDGEHFETIGQVKAVNTIDKKGYAFTDAQPLNGVNYYRLKMVETTGKSTYSAIKSIIFGKDLSARVYPSLFQDILTVDVNSSQVKGDVSIQIFDIAGNLMVNKKLNYVNGFGQVTMPTGNLTAGVYIVKIIENQAILQTKVTKL